MSYYEKWSLEVVFGLEELYTGWQNLVNFADLMNKQEH